MKKLGKDIILKNIENKEKNLDAFLHIEKEPKFLENKPLSGVFMGVKDNLQVKGMPLTNASKFFEDYISPYNATVVQNLIDSGVGIVGKLNMDEFAMGSATTYSAYKKTKNAFDFSRVPGGSSGGSAVAVAGEMVDFALGSDTGGSVRQPASYCGVYGFKPTYGVLSRYGLTAFSSSLDQVGILATSAKDTIEIMKYAAKKDEKDSTSIDSPEFLYEDVDFSTLKIGVVKEYQEMMSEGVKEKYNKLINFLKEKGAVVNELSFPEKEMVVPVYQIISTAEASTNLSRFDGIRYTKREKTENLQDVYKKSRAKYFGEEVKRRIILGTFVLSRDCYDSYYLKAAKIRTLILNRWTNFFKENDAVLIPSTADVAFEFDKQPDTISLYKEDLFTIPANLTGMPAISFPVGVFNNMPVGLQLVGDRLKDNKILNITAKIEKEFYNFEELKKELHNEK